MEIHYVLEDNYQSQAVFDPKTGLGVNYNQDEITSTSYRRGLPLRLIENPRVTRTAKYKKIKVDKRKWDKFIDSLSGGDKEKGEKFLKRLESLAESAPTFVQVTNDNVERKEYRHIA